MIKFNFPESQFDDTPANIEKWYDRHQRTWVIQIKNKNGDQLGNAEYVGTKEEANNEYKRLKKEYNL